MNEISVKEITFDEIRVAIKELTDSQKETDRQLKKNAQQHEETKRLLRENAIETERLLRESAIETERLLRESAIETERLMREGDLKVDRQFEKSAQQHEETKRLLRENAIETERLMREGDLEVNKQFEKSAQQLEKTGVEINRLNGFFGNQWGKLMESLVEGDLVKLLNERNIKVAKNKKRKKGVWQGKKYEFDIISVNSEVVVVTEVKTTLDTEDVDYFLYKLEHFKDMFPEHKDKTVYGAVAYLCMGDGVDRYAEKHGLFVIRATGSSASITNRVLFVPVAF